MSRSGHFLAAIAIAAVLPRAASASFPNVAGVPFVLPLNFVVLGLLPMAFCWWRMIDRARRSQQDTMRVSNLVLALAGSAALGLAAPTSAGAAGVVGMGNSASCTEAAFDTALMGGGLVTFDCGALPVTIPIMTTKNVTVATTLDGGDLITLDGGGSTQLFTVAGVAFTVQHITLANGRTVAMNVGGAAIDSTGGAVTIDHSTVSGNSTANAGCGAVNVDGALLTITSSTFTGNHVDAAAQGGALCVNSTGSLEITNSTLTGNFGMGGGGIFTSGPATITNTTIVDNTSNNLNGAINAFGDMGVVTLINSIVANNPGGNCSAAAGASFVDGGFNLQNTDTSCGASIPVADPRVAPLASNGGPTQTMALTGFSPALDAIPLGVNGCGTTIAVDQRDVDRPHPINGSCDIGAFESTEFPNVPAPALGPLAQVALILALATVGIVARRRRSPS